MATTFLDHPGPLAFAHRGGASHAPENSWRAFEHAVGLGYRYLETDLQATADGVLIAFHDRTLARVTGQPGRIARMAYRQVSGALIGGSEPIPLLEDLLGAWPDVRFNVDVKDAAAIGPLARVLERTSAWDRVCVVSFSAARLRATRRALGRPVCMATSPLGTAVVRFGGPRGRRDSSGPGRRALARPAGWAPGTALSSLLAVGDEPVPGGENRRDTRPGALAARLGRAGVRCVQVPEPVATPALIARAHAVGLQVHVWTVNDPVSMGRLLDLGVDGVMTDDTVALREVLTGRGQWHPRPAA